MAGIVERFPVKTSLLIANPFHGIACSSFYGFERTGFPIALGIDHALTANLSGQYDAVGRGQRFAGDAGFRVAGKKQINNRIGDLV